MRAWSKPAKRRAAIGTSLLLVLAWVLWPRGAEEPWLDVRFAGYTNAPGEINPVAVLVVSNRSALHLGATARLEVKTANRWQDEPLISDSHRSNTSQLRPGEVQTFNVYMLHPGKHWRVEVTCGAGEYSTWQKWRLRLAAWLMDKGMTGPAGVIVPREPTRSVSVSDQFVPK